MKKTLVPALTFIGIFLVAGTFIASAAQAESSDNIDASPKTVAIDNVPAEQTNPDAVRHGSMYDQIMQSQHRMDKRMRKFLNAPYFNTPQQHPASLSGMGRGYPKSRFYTKDKRYVLQFIIPGMDKENISIELHGNVLTVSATNSAAAKSKKDNNGQNYQSVSNSFTQSFTIPPDVNVAQITSNYKNGVLTIDLPKDLTKINQKTIKISVN